MTANDDELDQGILDQIRNPDEELRRFFQLGPLGYISAAIAGSILFLWNGVVAAALGAARYTEQLIHRAFTTPFVEAILSIRVFADVWHDLAITVGGMTAQLGMTAPIGMIAVWAVGIALTVVVLRFMLGAIDTYAFPLSWIPVIGRRL